jgi:hypothetical protein
MKKLTYIFLLVIMVVSYSCKKKEEFAYDDRITSLAYANSNTRIINLAINDQLTVNGRRLTAFIVPVLGNLAPITGTLYFPNNGRFTNGSIYTIPQDLLNSSGMATVNMTYFVATLSQFGGGKVDTTNVGGITFHTIDNQTSPNDYYNIYNNLTNYNGDGSDTVYTFPRQVSAPSDPTHIRIRVINIADQGNVSNLNGPLTLVYADGTPVSATTTNVMPGTNSPYVEIPYGSYQFFLQTQTGALLPCGYFDSTVNGQEPGIQYIDPGTGIMVDGNNNFLNHVYSPLQSYEPGGAYSIVASVNGAFIPFIDEGAVFINSFRAITDVTPPNNLTYARMEAVNTIAGEQVTVQVDGKPLGSALAFGAQTDYQVFVKGAHDVKAVDQTGKVIAESTINLTGNDVWTAWVYAVGSKTAIAFAFDNLSGNSYDAAAGGDDQTGINSVIHDDYDPLVRFLNFCPDLPYATFTDENGNPLQQNMTPGQVATTSVYSGVPPLIRVYQSQVSPLVVPGNWLSNIAPLQPTNFIANKAIYSKGNFTGLPTGAEPGVYTVALVGSLSGTAPANAHLIIVKHNK